MAWAQLPLILFFVRVGENVVGAEPMPISPIELALEFSESPSAFMQRFGMTGLHGILGWGLAAPLALGGAYGCLAPMLQRVSRSLKAAGAQ